MKKEDLVIGDVIKTSSSVKQTVVHVGNCGVLTEFFNPAINSGKKLMSRFIQENELGLFELVDDKKEFKIIIDGSSYSVINHKGKTSGRLTLGECFEQIIRESDDKVVREEPYRYE